jgi:hypothetical protein
MTEIDDYEEMATAFTDTVNNQLRNYLNASIMTYTSDYTLYWFDYKSGFDAVLAEFGGTTNRQLQLGLCRGAATAQGKDWGTIVTHWSSADQVMESGQALFDDLVFSYHSGAKYAVVFDWAESEGYPKVPVYTYEWGILTEEHFEALQNFWNYTQQNPAKHGSLKADTALVLPFNYGFGFRDGGDKIWGRFPGDRWSQALYSDAINALSQYGYRLDLVYKDPPSTPQSNQNTPQLSSGPQAPQRTHSP